MSSKIQDLHCHTLYSMDSNTEPEALIKLAVDAGIEVLAFTDHNYWIEKVIPEYQARISKLREKYSSDIKIVCGVEVASAPIKRNSFPKKLEGFEFVLLEHLGYNGGFTVDELLNYRDTVVKNARASIAHTDIFAFANKEGIEPFKLLCMLRDEDIAWELNVNLDNIHGGKPHSYVEEFFSNSEQQQIVKESGISVTVGFDNHIIEDYKPKRVADACNLLAELNISLIEF